MRTDLASEKLVRAWLYNVTGQTTNTTVITTLEKVLKNQSPNPMALKDCYPVGGETAS